MPSRNILKIFVEDGYYHIYNRGANRDVIFKDIQDYRVFLTYLKTYLLPKDEVKLRALISSPSISEQEKEIYKNLLRLHNFHNQVKLLAYCLMPNHFHLLVRQQSKTAIEHFMRALITRYVLYFNKRQNKVGPLFQGKYKAVLVESEQQLLYVSKYIHRNPLKLANPLLTDRKPIEGQPSSYPVYIGRVKQVWVHPEYVITPNQKRIVSYRSFVEEKSLGEDSVFIEGMMIDEND